VARQVRPRSLVLPYVRAIDETERRREVLADLLEDEIPAPRVVGEVDRERRGIIVALLARMTAHVIRIRLKNIAAEKVRVVVLQVDATNGVGGSARRIAIGEDEAH